MSSTNNKIKNRKIGQIKLCTMPYALSGAFTMIELLIVIAIIGVLTTASLFALRGTREAARDTQRKSALSSIASAIEIYKADCGYYPNSISPGTQLRGNGSSVGCANSNVYMEAVPDDPVPGRDYVYDKLGCSTNCSRFKLWANLEDPGPLPPGCTSPPGGCGGSGCNYCTFNN